MRGLRSDTGRVSLETRMAAIRIRLCNFDPRKARTSVNVTKVELEKIPTSRDPYGVGPALRLAWPV